MGIQQIAPLSLAVVASLSLGACSENSERAATSTTVETATSATSDTATSSASSTDSDTSLGEATGTVEEAAAARALALEHVRAESGDEGVVIAQGRDARNGSGTSTSSSGTRCVT
ncbi:hypothetical protein [Janibacter sp. UYMM211]|uniref:hypothetical protein n=1 Tax=Janibacter sp. UYMM211 TaxID=3156342 RepID=UPI003391E3EA